MDPLRDELLTDDEEDDDVISFGPASVEERQLKETVRTRKTELFRVNFRQSLLDYRQRQAGDFVYQEHVNIVDNMNRDSLEPEQDAEGCEEMDVSEDANVVPIDNITNSVSGDTTYFTCPQYSQMSDDLMQSNVDDDGEITSEILIAPPTSRSSFHCNDEFEENDYIPHNNSRKSEEVATLECDSISQEIPHLYITENEDGEEKENLCKVIETVSESCQTSFFDYPSNKDLEVAKKPQPMKNDPSPFKIPHPKPAILKKSNVNDKFSPSPNSKVPKLSPQSSKRFHHVVSPISQYINEAPPAPLILNIRGRDGNKQITPTKQARTLRSTNRVISNQTDVKLQSGLRQNSTSSNFSAISDESILERFGLTKEDFNKLEDKSLKRQIQKFIREEKSSLSLQIPKESLGTTSLIPVVNYKAPVALAAVSGQTETKLLTKLHTLRNQSSKLPVPSPRPIIMKHTGERKKLHWAKLTNKDKSGVPKSPVVFKLPATLDDSRMHDDKSMVEVSMVEVTTSAKSNTLKKL